jgi:hypothetical protein
VAARRFLILGNKNAITYKQVFALVEGNRIWIGATPMGRDLLFNVPEGAAEAFLAEGRHGSSYRIVDGTVMGRAAAVWFTNIDHGKRHAPLRLTEVYEE